MKTLKKKFKMYDPKLKEECAVFGISNTPEASTLTALGLHALQHRGKRVVELYHLMGKNITLKKDLV